MTKELLPGLGSGALREALETISAKVHEQWMENKRKAGVSSRKLESGEELMVPYEQLSEDAKELDRGSVRAVLNAQAALSLSSPIEPQHCNAPNPDGKYLCNKEPHSTGDHVHSFINPDKQNDFYFWPATPQASSEIREKK